MNQINDIIHGASRIPHRLWSRIAAYSLAWALLVPWVVSAQGPAWWYERGAVDPEIVTNDYAGINQGQLKHMASAAAAEMDASCGAGTGVTAMVGAFVNSNNYHAVNIGQLKYIAQPFYDRLHALNLTNTFPAGMPGYYPWDNQPETNDYAVANIGQTKYVFSFDSAVDTDGDGLPDWLEIYYGTNPYNADTDGDGLSDSYELANGTNPNNPDTDGDGLSDGAEITNGTNPLNPDTDGDGFSDGWEIANGKDPLNPNDADPAIAAALREAARNRIIHHWRLFYGTTPSFTNTPGSTADLNDLKDALNALSGKFYKVE